MRRVAAAALCITVSLTFVALALRADAASPATTETKAATAGWSARRVPTVVTDGVAALRLRADIADALVGTEACVVVEGPQGRLVDLSSTTPLVPASTIKILTAIGALVNLPESFRFATVVEARGPLQGGVVPQVTLVGGGDPLLGTPEWIASRDADPFRAGTPTTPLAELAQGVVDAGVRSIPGGVVGVAGRWGGEPDFLPGWPESYRLGTIGPLSSLTVDGGFRAPGEPAVDAALHAAGELARLLRDRGVEVGDASSAIEPSRGEELARVESVPLAELVGEMLATSDNLAAELLVRELASVNGASSTTEGVAVVHDTLVELGLSLENLVQHDGSGLDRASRVSCELLDAALVVAEQPALGAVRDGLAVAGELGTLAPRLVGSPLHGRLAAKTGTLPGVTGLAGYLEVGPPLRFVMLANGDFSEEAALPLREEVARILARYPDAPSPDLVPTP